ncbi:MAG: alpha/beta hydrolase [Chloroflexota bacterium]
MTTKYDYEQEELKRLEREGVALAYHYIRGLNTKQSPLVFVHGWAGSGEDWRKVVARYVARGESVLVYDAAGFGQSQFESETMANWADYSLSRYVQDLKALLDAEGIERVRLVGHSWGGVVAMSFAARYPERVEALVPIGSAYFDPEKLLHQVLRWVSYLIGWILIFLKPLLRRSPRLQRLAVRRYLYRPLDEADTAIMVNGVLQSHNRAIVQTLLEGYEVRFKKLCPTIQCPTLYIGSDHDAVAPVLYVTAFVPFTPHAKSATIKKCGHFPMIERPDELIAVMDGFF